MTISLTNFKTTLPSILLRKASTCAVRECDETAKGTFEAYVDEGPESFDVMLRLGKSKDVAEHRCDCNSTEPFCRHKAALLLTLAGKITTKSPTVKGKKAKRNKTDELLEAADADSLKAWVKSLLEKNKDLALAFEQHFGEKKTVYTKEEAEALTANAVKSVVKNRTRVEQAELKKIVETWTEVHKPLAAAYLANVAAEGGFLAFHAVTDSCLAYVHKLSATGVKIPNYVQSLLDGAAEPIAQLFSEEAFQTATGFYYDRVQDGANRIRLHYLLHLQKILSISSPGRLAAGVEKLVQQYRSVQPDQLFNGADYTKALFTFVEANGFLPTYLSVFKPIRFDNSFNTLLIEKLMAAGALDLAEKYANKQIGQNYREEYNLPYLELLKKIYRLQNKEDALATVIGQLLPFTFDFDDYLLPITTCPKARRKRSGAQNSSPRQKTLLPTGPKAPKHFTSACWITRRAIKK